MSSGFFASYLFLWVLVIVQFVGLLCLFHYQGKALITSLSRNQEHGPEVGARGPVFTPQSIAGSPLPLGGVSPRPRAIMFTSSNCLPCEHAMDAVGKLRTVAGWPPITVVCRGSSEEVAAITQLRGLDPTLVVADKNGQIGRLWSVVSVPFLVALDDNGVVVARGNPSTGGRLKEVLSTIRMAVENTHGSAVLTLG